MSKGKLFSLIALIVVFGTCILAQSESTKSNSKQHDILANITPEQRETIAKIVVLESKIEYCAMKVLENKKSTDECERNYPAQQLVTVYTEAFKDKALSKIIIGKIIQDYQALLMSPRSEPHFTRITNMFDAKIRRVLMAQNMLIAELLQESINTKK